ncbi:MAG: hypothetical protein JRM86_00460, partial [Nitrososphaerota archaeon]|nr:hypothetical protein [Nitrososphaerota archaeon]
MYWLSGGFVFKRVVSPFNRLDPRVRLLIAAEFFLLSLMAQTIWQIVLLVGAILAISAVARSLRRIGRAVAFSGVFALFIFGVNFVLGLGLLHAILYAARFLAIISSTSVFFVTTSPDE